MFIMLRYVYSNIIFKLVNSCFVIVNFELKNNILSEVSLLKFNYIFAISHEIVIK